MANSKGPSTIRTMMYNGKNSLLPPKSPFPSLSPSYTEYIPNSTIGSKILPKKPGDSSLHHHQRTSSESFLMDEQPSWLDELLDEPETPVRSRGHRRSSSDSFAYTDMSNTGFMNNNNSYVAQDGNNNNGYGNMAPLSSWGSHDFDIYRDARQNAFYMDLNNFGKTRNKMWDPPAILPHGLPSPRRNNTLVNTSQDGDKNSSLPDEKRDTSESGHQDPKGPAEKEPPSHGKPTETDNKRAKQQFAQRSRVRKLQYIAELERNVQALQAEGSEVSAELEFVNQQNLILSMENKALKQRLDNLAEEQLIKYLEHQLLEREVGRLRSLYEHQQQPPQQQPQTGPGHRRANSRDLDQQFSNLSLKPKEGRDSVSGQLHM